MNEYLVLYGTLKKEVVKSNDKLSAEKKAHERAKKLKTIVLSVNLINQ